MYVHTYVWLCCKKEIANQPIFVLKRTYLHAISVLKMMVGSWSVIIQSRNIITLPSPLEMYSKFVLPNWNLLGYMLK